MVETLTREKGALLKDYIDLWNPNDPTKWKWTSLVNSSINDLDNDLLMETLKERQIFPSNWVDRLKWVVAKLCDFSIKEGYRIISP